MAPSFKRHLKPLLPLIPLLNPILAGAETATELPEMEVTAKAFPAFSYATSEASTASRTPSKILNTPYSVSVVTAPLLQDTQALRLEDTAQFVSGVQPSSQQSGFDTDLTIRGFSTAGSTYLNGLLDNLNYEVRDMALIERVEILKGQSSVLYGAGNPGGSVNYISKKPLPDMQHKATISAGNYDYGRVVLDSTGQVSGHDKLLYRMIAVGQLAHEFRDGIVNDKATLAPSLTWEYAQDATLSLDFEYSYQNQPYRFDNVYTQKQVVYDQSYADPRQQSDRDYWRFSGAIHQPLADKWALQLSSHYFHGERHDLLIGSYTFINPTTLSGYYRDVHDHYDQFSVRIELQGSGDWLGAQHHVLLGVEETETDDRLNSLRNIGGFALDVFNPRFDYALPVNLKPLNFDTTTHELGFYGHDQLDWGRFWHVSGGVRYSLFDKTQNQKRATDQDALTFNAGLSFTPTDTLSGYFGFSQSFKPNQGLTKNANFLPAKQGELLELGVKSTFFDGQLSANAAAYQLQQSNLTTVDPTDSDYGVTNGKVRSQGLELDITGKLTERLSVVANYSWVAAKFVQHDDYQGNTFRSTPSHSGAVWGKYRLPITVLLGTLQLGAGAFLVGRRQGDDANSFEVPGYVRADTFVGYQHKAVNLQLKVENLLDKRYVGSSNFDDTVIQGNRLLFRAMASVAF